MKLYHLSTDIHHNGVFEPRIPSKDVRMKGEESETPRICVALTLEGCFSAIPSGGSRLDSLNESQKGYYKVFEIDTEKLGISDSDILNSDFLYESGKVEDAYITDEHWITTGFAVPTEDSYVILLQDWEEEVHDLIPYHVMKAGDDEYDGDYCEAYCDIMESDHVPCVNAISSLDFKTGALEDNQEIELPHLDEFDLEFMNERFAHSDIELEMVDDLFGECVVKGNGLTVENLAITHLACAW